MLKNLIKHELRATAKIFVWLYIAFVAIAVVNALFTQWEPAGITSITLGSTSVDKGAYSSEIGNATTNPLLSVLAMLYFLAIAAIAIGTFVVLVLRFYRNLLGDEGYLMMTLPVSREQLVFSKLLVALIWSICSAVLIFLSMLLLITGAGGFEGLVQGITSITAMGLPLARWVTLIVIMMIVCTIASILTLYAAMAIGPNLLRNRLGGSVLAFIIIAIASQILTAVAMYFSAIVPGGLNGIIPTDAIIQNGDIGLASYAVMDQFVNIISLAVIVCSAVIAIICWFLTRYMLNKKLNLT